MAKHPAGTYEVHGALSRALRADTADECAELLSHVSGQFDVFRESVPPALRVNGRRSRSLSVTGIPLFKASCNRRPTSGLSSSSGLPTDWHRDLLAPSESGADCVTSTTSSPILPFSPLMARFGSDVGVGVVAIDAFRMLLPGCPPLNLGTSAGWPDLPDGTDSSRFRRLVDLALRSMQPHS